MYQTAIFDLDGTLLNTLDDLAAAVNAALAAHKMPARSTDDVRRFVGNGYVRLIALCVPANTDEATCASVHDAFQRYYAHHATDLTAPYPGTRELLHKLKEAGVACGVVSNKGDEAVQLLVERFFGELVSVCVGEREGIRRKPAPDSTYAVMRELHADASTCVYIGDSEVDIATAAAAGLPAISVTWGFRSKEELLAAGATTLVHNCSELATAIVQGPASL